MPDLLRLTNDELRQLRSEDPFLAFDLAAERLEKSPEDTFLRHIQAYALKQTGSPRRGIEILASMYDEGHRDPETLGLLGSAWKDIAAETHCEKEKSQGWERARRYYLEGFIQAEAAGDPAGYYPGINAATLSLLMSDRAASIDLARRAAALAERVGTQDYWSTATAAEAALLVGSESVARDLYRKTGEFRPSASQVASTRAQARLLGKVLLGSANALDDCFHVPPVVAFVGHLTDAPGRSKPRFPESLVERVSGRLADALDRLGAEIGYASAARGGDLLFLKALQDRRRETHVVLPVESEVFRNASVHGGESYWNDQYDEVLRGARSVRIANGQSSSTDPSAFEYGTRILLGLARLRARQLETELHVLAMWNGESGDGRGGTAWAIGHLLNLGVTVENLYPGCEGIVRDIPSSVDTGDSSTRPIHALLFSDCKGYSKLREEHVGDFTLGFLQRVASLIRWAEAEGFAPSASNTWGDGLFLVFSDVSKAGRFALALRDLANSGEASLDPSSALSLRIGLHAGPVTPFSDPITGRQNFAGVNVAFAARIEPIARENQVYVSEAFAALSADAGADELAFDYVGRTPFAKQFGSFPLYQLKAGR